MKIAIGADHRGFKLKNDIMEHFNEISWVDVGAPNEEKSDYPIFAQEVCQSILQGESDLGILICGTGVGMSIVANRFAYIHAALAWNEEIARRSKEDDYANILVLPADYIKPEEAIRMIKSWLEAEPKGGEYDRRVRMIDPDFHDPHCSCCG